MPAQHATLQTKTYDLDPAHSAANFRVKHLMIATVRGRMDVRAGEVHHDPAAPEATRIVAEMDVASIDTGNKDRDAHLRSADFFDAENHPTLRFESTRTLAAGADRWRLEGTLTIRGTSKPVVLEVERIGEARTPWGDTRVGIVATTTIDRKQWGLGWNEVLETGGVMVGDEVKIEINAELVERAQGGSA